MSTPFGRIVRVQRLDLLHQALPQPYPLGGRQRRRARPRVAYQIEQLLFHMIGVGDVQPAPAWIEKSEGTAVTGLDQKRLALRQRHAVCRTEQWPASQRRGRQVIVAKEL